MASATATSAQDPGINDPRPLLRERLIVNYARLHRFAARQLPGRGEAEDLVHNVFLRIEQVPRDSVIVNPDAYLFAMTSNLRIAALRQRGRHLVLDMERLPDGEPAMSLVAEGNEVAARIDTEARIAMLREVLGQLPAGCRAVMQLRFVQELSRDEIARRLGITVDGVKKHLKRGLVECRRRMQRLA